jgi:hypothetical protein
LVDIYWCSEGKCSLHTQIFFNTLYKPCTTDFRQLHTGCPIRYRTRHLFNNFTASQQLGALHTHYRHLPLLFLHNELCRHPRPNDREISIDVRQAGNRLPGWLADRCSVSQQLGALQTQTTDTFLFISHTMKLPLFKFRCNIFIGVRITKEMTGSVASGRNCTYIDAYRVPKILYRALHLHTAYSYDSWSCTTRFL